MTPGVRRSVFLVLLVWSAGLPSLNAAEVTASIGEHRIVFPAGYHGLNYFPDEPIAVLSTKPFRYLLVADGTYLMQGRTLDTAVPVHKVLAPGPKTSYDNGYAGITSIYFDKKTRQWLGLYHAEDHVGLPKTSINPDINGAYWSIALVISKDNGNSFQKLGQVLTSGVTKKDMKWEMQGIGDVCMIADPTETYLLAYFTDLTRRKGNETARIGLARCRIADGGRPGKWFKYRDGDFKEKGLGGENSAVVDPPKGFPSEVINPRVTYLPPWKKYLMVCNVVANGEDGKKKVEKGGIYFSHSDDGIKWTEPKVLVIGQPIPYQDSEYVSHPSLLFENVTSNSAEGWLLYCYSPRWGTQAPRQPHHLARRPISFTVAETPQADDKPLAFSAVSLTIDQEGKAKLTVDTRSDKDAHTPGTPKGKSLELAIFGQATVTQLPEDRLHVAYDFKKLKDVSRMTSTLLSPDEQRAFEKQVAVDADEGVLVLKPDHKKRARLTLPRPVLGPIDLTAHLAPVREGMFQIQLQMGQSTVVISLHGQNSEELAGTVTVSQKGQKSFDSLLKVTQPASEKKVYDFSLNPDVARQRAVLAVAYLGDVPLAIPRLEIAATFPPMFGIQLVERGGKIVAGRVVDGGAAAKAGVKEGDVLVKVNGTAVKDVPGAMKLLAEGGLTKDATVEVERYGRQRTIKVSPQ